MKNSTLTRLTQRAHMPLRVALIGVGGTGSDMLMNLVRIHHGLKAMGRPGLHVDAYDPDAVSEANIVRQHYTASDLGRNKALTLVSRINAAYGLLWTAHPRRFEKAKNQGHDIVLSCVDTRKSRAEILEILEGSGVLWGDFGNDLDFGQVVFGELRSAYSRQEDPRLPCAHELHPELFDTTLPEDDTPSCSALEALANQDLFVNKDAALRGAEVLWAMLSTGEVEHHGCYFNLKTMQSNGIRPPTAAEVQAAKPKRTRRPLLVSQPHPSSVLPFGAAHCYRISG